MLAPTSQPVRDHDRDPDLHHGGQFVDLMSLLLTEGLVAADDVARFAQSKTCEVQRCEQLVQSSATDFSATANTAQKAARTQHPSALINRIA